VRCAPEVFSLSDGKATVLAPHPDDALHPKVTMAAEFCPTGAITVVD
jgi:ferredoxin